MKKNKYVIRFVDCDDMIQYKSFNSKTTVIEWLHTEKPRLAEVMDIERGVIIMTYQRPRRGVIKEVTINVP